MLIEVILGNNNAYRKTMKTLAITGLSGVIGAALLRHVKTLDYQVYDLYHNRPYAGNYPVKKHIPFDLLQKNGVTRVLESEMPDKIIHMAAVTHIEACESDKQNGKNGVVWKTNVEGTRAVAEFAQKNNTPVIFLSTECVFDGKNEFYDESSIKNPINWYGRTKSEAEDILLSTCSRATIIRAAIAYHKHDGKKTLFGKMQHNLRNNLKIHAVSDQFITPTYTYDLTRIIHEFIKNGATGIHHVSCNQSVTPFEFAHMIANSYGYTPSLIQKVTLDEFYGRQQAALRPRHACLWTNDSRTAARSPQSVFG